MTITLKYYEDGGQWYGEFGNNMSYETITSHSREKLISLAKQMCEDKFGKEKMLRVSLVINRKSK
ncbi:hypothetical protein [Fulvivirga ligni]|uniref:hypothetical protein n=1 Tax=Fulvivirga ligni TaxID=2904246 RepID=UPI001F37DE8B|nr:hypothetical protein [Fulvivirga ligni]UII21191.1 hypothetical protein LVD16_25480 [Fulvivirga ligni]